MDVSRVQQQSKRLLIQRNTAMVVGGLLGVGLLVSVFVNSGKEQEIILSPVIEKQVRISSREVSPEYLEAVTRDMALLVLNRSPDNLDYWRQSILKMADPSAYGAINTELEKVVKAQRGTTLSQYFTMTDMHVDPERLESTVSGHVHTVIGSKEVGAEFRRFRFAWVNHGMSLKLVAFGQIVKAEEGAQQ
jgi:conjugal transfer pilus assembly protein TraE